jgi:D-serine deaminase-like pyridoxal phosphate-dependent protein
MSKPLTLVDIPTPALIVDVRAMERNLRRMAEFFAGLRCKLRPHFKAHKTPEIARRQLAAGSCTGLTCATVSEAEIAAPLCQPGHDLLIANEIVDTEKCRRVAALAAKAPVIVAADSAHGVAQISAAATATGVTIGVLVDVNVGQNRCGVAPGSDAVALARRVATSAGLKLRGLMGYEGHAVGIYGRADRDAAVRRSMEELASTVRLFREHGLPTEIVSSGGTGSYDIGSRFEEITEIQAGSYALMDTEYAKLDLPFEHAFAVLGTVVSRPTPERCVVDSGHKSCTKDHGNPSVKGIAGASVVGLNDEHAILSLPPASSIAIGDRVQLLPSHIDPTINLHDVLYALEDDLVVDIWPIAARGYPEHR